MKRIVALTFSNDVQNARQADLKALADCETPLENHI